MSDIVKTEEMEGHVREVSEGNFKAHDTIVNHVSIAKQLHSRLREAHVPRMELYAAIDNLIQGSPPYDPIELANAGLQHIANFNDMSVAAFIERAALAYWNLLHSSQHLVKFEINIPGNPETGKYAEIMSRNWDYAIKKKWRSFNVQFSALAMQLVKFGVSPVFFNDEKSPKWRVVELSRFYVPDLAQTDIDMLSTVMVETTYTVQELWEIYEDSKGKENSPWNSVAVGKLLVHLTASNLKTDTQDLNIKDLEQKKQNNDAGLFNTFSDSTKLISLFQKEYGGKISHFMFHRYFNEGTTGEEFIYEQPSQYESINEALIIFTINPGSSTIHSNRGIGHKTFSLGQAKIQAGCSVLDMVKWASTPIIEGPSLTTKEAESIRFYPGVPTFLGAAKLAQNNLGANVQNAVTGVDFFRREMTTNISYSGGDPSQPDPDQGSLSPSQARLNAFQEFGVLRNVIQHFYDSLDYVIQNMTAKMLRSKEGYEGYNIYRLWKKRCIAQGVPEIVFDIPEDDEDADKWEMPSTIDVYASRAAGQGSVTALLIALQELQAIVGSFTPKEEAAFKRLYVQATIGAEYLDEFLTPAEQEQAEGAGGSLAGLENNDMRAGSPARFDATNDHRVHIPVHLELAQEITVAVNQQQMDVIQANSVFEVLIPHLGDHIQVLGENPFAQSVYQQYKPVYDGLVRYATLNKKNALAAVKAQQEKQRQMAEETDRVMNEEELKNFQAQADNNRQNIKLSETIQNERELRANKTEMERFKTTEEARNKRIKTDAEVQAIKMKASLTNTASEDAAENPSAAITNLLGRTINPTDIEG